MSIKNIGPFTAKIQNLKPDEKVYVDGPHGYFSMDRYPDAERLVMIPGGIGITPIMSMLRTMADRGDKRPVLLFYCNVEWETVTFKEEIEYLKDRLNLQVIYTIEKPPANWSGESGFLNSTILMRYLPDEWISGNVEVFLCGPTPMMNAVEKALIEIGLPEKRIHTERYAFV